jgi:hypothetical protein
VAKVEEVYRCRILPLEQANLQCVHEAGRRHPEVVPHHHHALHTATVALPQSLHEFRILFGILFGPLGVKPLLELVEDE